MFALPAFDNGSDREITIRSVRVEHVTGGVRVIDYRSLTYRQSGGMALGWNRREVSRRDAPLLAKSGAGVAGIVASPHDIADRYALVHLRVETAEPSELSGVEVTYEQDGVLYRQEMSGEWRTEVAASDRS